MFYQNKFSNFGLEFYYEYNSSCPITFEEYKERVTEIHLYTLVVNEYFDPSDREDPIKRLITDKYLGYFSPNVFNRYNLFVEKNTYQIEGGLFNSQKNGKFYTVSKENTHITKLTENKPK